MYRHFQPFLPICRCENGLFSFFRNSGIRSAIPLYPLRISLFLILGIYSTNSPDDHEYTGGGVGVLVSAFCYSCGSYSIGYHSNISIRLYFHLLPCSIRWYSIIGKGSRFYPLLRTIIRLYFHRLGWNGKGKASRHDIGKAKGKPKRKRKRRKASVYYRNIVLCYWMVSHRWQVTAPPYIANI